MQTYDPEKAPDAEAWLALDEATRTRLVEAAHQPLPAGHPPMPQPRLHASIHVVVENQLALGNPPTVRAAMDRLTRAGLGRHQAVHEVGTVVSSVIFDVVKARRPFNPAAYDAALDALGKKPPSA